MYVEKWQIRLILHVASYIATATCWYFIGGRNRGAMVPLKILGIQFFMSLAKCPPPITFSSILHHCMHGIAT